MLVRTSLFAPDGASSTILKLIMSTMLDTSFLMLSGREDGSIFPVSFKLHKYIASANSGKYSCPARVVSANVQMCDNESPSSLERIRRSRAFSPDIAVSSPTADLKSVSNRD